jgi:chromosome segregation ATPase
MEAEDREQAIEEAHADATADADELEERTDELGESIDGARDQWEEAQNEIAIGGSARNDEEMEEDPPAPAQEPPGDD